METNKSKALREKAKQILMERGKVTPEYAHDLEMLIEELNIYQIELEQQNNNLRETQLKLQDSQEQYIDLFNNAPVGYVVINKEMEILKTNNLGAKLLNYPLSEIINTKFSKYISPDFQDTFYLYFNQVISNKPTSHCEIALKNNNRDIYISIESVLNSSKSDEAKTVRMALTDISNQRKTYNKLEISENKYRAIFENSGDGFLVLTDKIEDANLQAATIYGYTLDELIGLHPGRDLSPKEQPDGKQSESEALVKIQNAIKHGYQKFYWQHITKDGTLIDTEITLALYTSDPSPKIIAVVRDITAQKKYEQLLKQKNEEIAAQNHEYSELNKQLNEAVTLLHVANKEITESEGKFRNYLESSPTPIIIIDHENKATFCNTAAGKLSGYLNDSRTNFNNFFVDINKNAELLQKIKETGRINNYECQIKTENGDLINVMISANRIEQNQVILFITDVSTIIEAEKVIKDNETRLQLALEGAYEGMWDWNIKTGQVVFNNIWAEMLGYKLDEIEPNVKAWDGIIHPDDKDETYNELQKHLDGKTERYESEHRLKTKSGDYKWILDRGKVVEWDDEGKPLRAIGTHLDISRQKQTEQELKKAKERAETADNLKSAFLSNMSHEIRTPMNGIIGFTEILSKKNYSPEKRNRIFGIIQTSSKQLLQLINDIVDISKIEANQLNIFWEDFQIDEMLAEIAEMAKMDLLKQNKNQSVKFELVLPKDQVPLKIHSSSNRLRQAITNLVNNAIKFTHEGYIKIGYKIINKTHVQIFVEDTGIGISEKGKNIIFERFSQATPETTKKYGGTGLGLFITRQLIEKLHGEITVESEQNKGSIFKIKIPISKAADTEKQNEFKETSN